MPQKHQVNDAVVKEGTLLVFYEKKISNGFGFYYFQLKHLSFLLNLVLEDYHAVHPQIFQIWVIQTHAVQFKLVSNLFGTRSSTNGKPKAERAAAECLK